MNENAFWWFCVLLVPVSVALAAIVALACRWMKVREAYVRHRGKIAQGHVVVSARFRTWSDGCDVEIRYSDGDAIVIADHGDIPSWAHTKGKG
jgi:hypothetical protein